MVALTMQKRVIFALEPIISSAGSDNLIFGIEIIKECEGEMANGEEF